MPEPSRPNAAGAGFLLLATVLLCTGVGLGLGALVDLAFPLAVVGFFAGFAIGFALVYSRFKDL